MQRRQELSILPTLKSPLIPAVALSLAVSVAVVRSLPIAVALAIAPAALLMARRSATIWVIGAVIVALTFRAVVGIGAVPGYVQFAHLPLAWGALSVALIRNRSRSVLAHRCFVWLSILAGAVVASTLLNSSQPTRGLAYFLLLGEPFALVCAMLLDPPNGDERKLLTRVCVALVAVQIPLCYWQAHTSGWGDSVQGTLYGSGAGAHVIAGVVVVGAFWFLAKSRRVFSPISLSILALMAGILLITDAKQVTFTLPVVLIAQRSLSLRTIAMALMTLGVVFAVLHFRSLNQGYTIPYIDRALSGQTGKQAAAKLIWHDATGDVGTFVFGQGPAETVSRTAYQTIPSYQKSASSLGALGLHPARTAVRAEEAAAAAVKATGRSAYIQPFNLDSFDSGMSSGVGLFGDLGLMGFVAYGGLFTTIFLSLRRRASPEAFAAASGLAMLSVLGFILGWWEEPALTVFLGALAGLALTRPTAPGVAQVTKG
jgi:hypothetical protein